ncbi:extracellular solute-binding protein [Cohnella rhizosphaerae]|uniref:Extracellular solute-binding protein n=1 Tax=Cohnella rhizosphaerae TaxID=1457232 RepID=A0A9X4KQ98_9BACL|nr:extracellular solute-binding protein [Cohnella rhizosphaerae]MDG0809226.1 extracellular solute-binding protein [Cohnella rhizosphaerae]
MKKKFTAYAAALLALTMLLAGCSGSKNGNAESSASAGASASSSASDNFNAPGTLPVVKNQETLTVWASPPSWVGDLNENWFTKYFEEKTNIKINWVRANMEDYRDKLNLLLASNTDLPDVILSWGISNAQQIAYGSQGLFLPLNELIDKYGSATKQVFDYNPIIKSTITAPDGNIYGLPSINECFHCTYSHKMWINQKWLDQLGLQMPKTTDEFYAVLKAFKEKDPNGNGKADEIPLTRGSWQGGIDFFLMNAFIDNEAGNRLMLQDDKVVQAPVQPEWKEGLSYLHKLYAEGLIDPEFLLEDDNKVKILTGTTEADNKVGAVASGGLSWVDWSDANTVKDDYVAVPPLTGPAGVSLAKEYAFGMGVGNFVITKAAKNPELAMRFGDAIYQLYLEGDYNLYGQEGDVWEKAKAGEVGLDGSPAKYNVLKSGEQPNNFTWGNGLNSFMTNEWRNGQVVTPGVWNSEKILYDETKNKYEGKGPKQVMPGSFMMPEDEATEWEELNNAVIQYLDESVAKFVTGSMDLNKDWDKYLSELKKIGYDRLTELTQKAYDRQYKGKM